MQDRDLEKISELLAEKYPVPETELNHKSPFELLVATILSAQTTDKQVNRVTAGLFQKYSEPEDFAKMEPEGLAEEIKSLGLYRNKARFIIETSRKLISDYQGEVPADFGELLSLKGVGRKTASVVLCSAFDKPAFPVDTHVLRVANRLGLADSSKPEEVESQLKELFPREEWGSLHHRLIFHGREICQARNPACEICMLKSYCLYYQNLQINTKTTE